MCTCNPCQHVGENLFITETRGTEKSLCEQLNTRPRAAGTTGASWTLRGSVTLSLSFSLVLGMVVEPLQDLLQNISAALSRTAVGGSADFPERYVCGTLCGHQLGAMRQDVDVDASVDEHD